MEEAKKKNNIILDFIVSLNSFSFWEIYTIFDLMSIIL